MNPVDGIPARLFDLAAGLPDPLPAEPLATLEQWLADATRAKRIPNPNAMVLATSTPEGHPSARVVLCKEIDAARRAVVFFTNYNSRKGRELEGNPRVAAVFHWDHAERQARLEGSVEKLSPEESDAYYATRPLLSRIGAWASHQSQPLPQRRDLLSAVKETMDRFGVSWLDMAKGSTSREVPRPPHWGGFRIDLQRVELWQGVIGRLHDRAVWTWSPQAGRWTTARLQP